MSSSPLDIRFISDADAASIVAITASDGAHARASVAGSKSGGPLADNLLLPMHRYWQAANYLTVGQSFLQENALLREPLRPEHTKPPLLGHWETSPGLSLVYVHMNRLSASAI